MCIQAVITNTALAVVHAQTPAHTALAKIMPKLSDVSNHIKNEEGLLGGVLLPCPAPPGSFYAPANARRETDTRGKGCRENANCRNRFVPKHFNLVGVHVAIAPSKEVGFPVELCA